MPTTDTITLRPHLRQYLAEVLPMTLFLGIVLAAVRTMSGDYLPDDFCSQATVALCVASIAMLAAAYLKMYTHVWSVTADVLASRTGIFVMHKEYMELYRVVDFSESQTFMQKLLGVKSLVVYSTDRSDKALLIFGLPEGCDMVSELRRRVADCKRRNNIYEITNR